MLRSTTLTAAALIGLALLAPTSAGAAGETCGGQPATLVGSFGQDLVGTEGADVIVTNGSTRVDALGGDDLVCVTGSPARGTLFLDAGAGDDQIEVAAPQWGTITTLGTGADTFVATNERSQIVSAGAGPAADHEADVVRIAAAGSSVSTGTNGELNADVIEVNRSSVQWHGVQTAPGSITASSDHNQLYLVSADSKPDLDARAGSMTAADTSLSFSGFSQFTFTSTAANGKFRFRGSHRDERLTLMASKSLDRYVVLGGGDDHYASNSVGGEDSAVRGSGGRNTFVLSMPRHRVKADLRRGEVAASKGGHRWVARAGGFTDLTVAAKRATVNGGGRSQNLTVVACTATVNAGAGSDLVEWQDEIDDSWDPPKCSRHRLDARGGRGRDHLIGSPGNDRLDGGRGKDRVEGRGGHDRCQGEVRRTCEKRI